MNYMAFLIVPMNNNGIPPFRVFSPQEAEAWAKRGFHVFKVHSDAGFEIYKFDPPSFRYIEL